MLVVTTKLIGANSARPTIDTLIQTLTALPFPILGLIWKNPYMRNSDSLDRVGRKTCLDDSTSKDVSCTVPFFHPVCYSYFLSKNPLISSRFNCTTESILDCMCEYQLACWLLLASGVFVNGRCPRPKNVRTSIYSRFHHVIRWQMIPPNLGLVHSVVYRVSSNPRATNLNDNISSEALCSNLTHLVN